jgi:cell division protein FtsB
MQKTIFVFLIILLAILQYRFWFSKANHSQINALEKHVEVLKAKIENLQKQNRKNESLVILLKKRLDAIEEYARFELNMKKPNEEFYLLQKK